jgi:hypothetical protein
MRRHRGAVAASGVLAAAVLAACGGAAGPTTTTTGAPGTSTTSGAVQVLDVTPSVETQLVAAGAAAHGLTPVAYRGLARGLTYYAYDATTKEYWAGARLVPSPDSEAAMVAAQDDGSYQVFVSAPGRGWTAYDDGLGNQPGAHCAVVVPLPVRLAWGWSLSGPCGAPRGQ